MRSTIAFSLLWLSLVAGCKKKQSDDVPKTDPVVVTGDGAPAIVIDSGAAASDDIALATGETYFGGKRTSSNVHEWKTPDGATLKLVVVNTGKGADGRQEGALRVYRDGKSVDVGRKFSVVTTGDHWAELKQLANGLVLFRYGDATEDRRARNAVLLRYDNDAKEVRVVKRWSGSAKMQEPEWVATGEYKPGDLGGFCEKVVARMVACEKDEKFRTSLTVRDDEADRAGILASFDKDIATWRKADGAKKQCERWASADYVETTFGDRAKLERLAKDAADPKLSCELFAAEIVDEGGLPRAVANK